MFSCAICRASWGCNRQMPFVLKIKSFGANSKGQLDRDLIDNVKLRNDVSSKIGMIRSNLRKQGKKHN